MRYSDIKKWSVIETKDLALPDKMIVLGFIRNDVIAISLKSGFRQQKFSKLTVDDYGNKMKILNSNGKYLSIDKIFKSKNFAKNIKSIIKKGMI